MKRRNEEFVIQDRLSKRAKEIAFEVADSKVEYSLALIPRDVAIFIFKLLDWLSVLRMRQVCRFTRAACSFEILDKACLRALSMWPKFCSPVNLFTSSAVTCHSRESEEARCSCKNPIVDNNPYEIRRAVQIQGGGGYQVQYEARKKLYCGHEWILPKYPEEISVMFNHFSKPPGESEITLCSCAHPDDATVFAPPKNASPWFNKAQIYYENYVKTWQEIVIATLRTIDGNENRQLHDNVHLCYTIGGWDLAFAYASKHKLSEEFVQATATYEAYMKYIYNPQNQ